MLDSKNTYYSYTTVDRCTKCIREESDSESLVSDLFLELAHHSVHMMMQGMETELIKTNMKPPQKIK